MRNKNTNTVKEREHGAWERRQCPKLRVPVEAGNKHENTEVFRGQSTPQEDLGLDPCSPHEDLETGGFLSSLAS